MKRILLFITILVAFSTTANAQFYEWVGGSGNWDDPYNWENEFGDPELPGYGADVYIGGNDVFLYFNPEFTELYNSITIYDNATVLASDPIVVMNNFSLEEFSSVHLQINDVNHQEDGFIEVLNGTYDIDGNIVPVFGGYSFVPQIGDVITVASASGSGSTCGIFNTGNAITTVDGISMFEVAYGVQCISPNEIILNINGINYTGAKSWDGEAGNGFWSTPENWDPNGVPTSDDWVIINKNGGASVTTGAISQDRLTIGNNNSLSITGNIEVSRVLKVSETASLNWSLGTLKKRVEGDFPIISNLGTLSVNGITIIDTGTITNNESGIIEMNGNININDGRIFNINGGTININADNLTIGYTSGSEHRLYNASLNSTIVKTASSGTGTSYINLTEFDNIYNGILRSEQGTLAIGENLVNTNGTITGSGAFSFPSDFVNTGIISPGSSPGILTVAGDLTTSSAATFDIEIDGPTVGTDYDRVVVQNNADISGDINVILGYLPPNDAVFEIISATSLNTNNLPATIEAQFNGSFITFTVEVENDSIYLVGPGATLNIDNVLTSETLSVYPNPAKDIIHIKSKHLLDADWHLINQLGQILSEGNITSSETMIKTNNLNNGVYFLNINDKTSNQITIRKVVISH